MPKAFRQSHLCYYYPRLFEAMDFTIENGVGLYIIHTERPLISVKVDF
jgi:hypothetical protein